MQPQPADPRLGVWKMNIEKSQYGARPKPKSSTVTWTSQGDGMYGYTADGIGPDGQPTHVTFSARFDGQDYKVTGSPILDAVSVKRIDARHIEATAKKNGQVILTTTVLEKRRLLRRLDPRLDPNECAIVFSSEQVQQAVRPLTHIANSLLQIAQHAFAMQLLPFVVEIETLQMT